MNEKLAYSDERKTMSESARPRLQKFHEEIVAAIPCIPNTREARAELAAKHLGDLLITCMNWLDRRIPPRKRQVIYSEQFWRSPNLPEHLAAVLELERMMTDGSDLTAHLSDRIDQGFTADQFRADGRKKSSRWDDKDLALNGYDVHHLHLGKRKASGRVAGSMDLLFVSFRRDVAFVVMLGDHNSFDNGTLLRAVAQWRAQRNEWILKGILPAKPCDDAAVQKLARHGMTTLTDVDGQAVAGALISTAGTSMIVGQHIDKIQKILREIDPLLDDPSWVAKLFAEQEIPVPGTLEFEWGLSYCDLILIEKTSNTHFLWVHWRR